MALLDRVKNILRDKEMSFTDLASTMEAPRSSLYKSLQTESIKYTTLRRLAKALDLEVYNLVTVVDTQKMEFLEDEVFLMLYHMNQLSRQLVKLKHNKITINEIQEEFNSIAESIQKKWPQRILTMDQIEVIYNLKNPAHPEE